MKVFSIDSAAVAYIQQKKVLAIARHCNQEHVSLLSIKCATENKTQK